MKLLTREIKEEKHVYYFPSKKSKFRREIIQKQGDIIVYLLSMKTITILFSASSREAKWKDYIVYMLNILSNFIALKYKLFNKPCHLKQNNVTKCYNIFMEREKKNPIGLVWTAQKTYQTNSCSSTYKNYYTNKITLMDTTWQMTI